MEVTHTANKSPVSLWAWGHVWWGLWGLSGSGTQRILLRPNPGQQALQIASILFSDLKQFIYLIREREQVSMSGRGADKEGESENPHCQCRARLGPKLTNSEIVT